MGRVEIKMAIVPVIWAAWGLSVLVMIGVRVYAARLGRNEEDQLFLADSSNHAKTEQDAIAVKVGKIEPVKKMMWVLVGAMTLLVLIYYIFDMIKQFR
jgi:hypothetical protein